MVANAVFLVDKYLVLLFTTTFPLSHRPLSHPLLSSVPGPLGLARVFVSTWPSRRWEHVTLVCPRVTQHPWVEHENPIYHPLLRAWITCFSYIMNRLFPLASAMSPDLSVVQLACSSLILACMELMVECCWGFVVVRRSVLATNALSVSWLVVSTAAMFSM